MSVEHQDKERPISIGFMLDERPHLFINNHIANERFLAAVNPAYWQYQAEVHSARLTSESSDERQLAAAALRVVYGQAVETMFALIGAFVQVPRFPLAWLMRYQNRDLRAVVEKIHTGLPFPSALRNRPSWEETASVVFGYVSTPEKPVIVEGFSKLWRRLAAEFLSDHFEPEYNSLKHGMRAAVGGFSVSMGPQKQRGQRAAPEDMRPLGGSEYGSSFWMPPERLDGKRLTFELRLDVTRAWVPEQFALALPLIGISIANIVGRAQIAAGKDPATIQFQWHRDPEAYDAPWDRFPSISTLTTSQKTIPLPTWKEPTDQDIRDAYKQTWTPSDDEPPQPRDEI